MLFILPTSEVVGLYNAQGMFAVDRLIRLPGMQLIQIGEVKQKTVLDLVQEMAARQFAEIEQLKRASLSAASAAREARNLRRRRCNSSKRIN